MNELEEVEYEWVWKFFEHSRHSFQWGNISGKTLNILEHMTSMDKKRHGNKVLIEMNDEIFEWSFYVEKCGSISTAKNAAE